MNFASYKDGQAVAAALKAVYTPVDATAAEAALVELEESDLAAKYPAIASNWRRAWNEVIPFLDYPPEVRRLIYTTNAIEVLNSKIRRAVRTRGHFASDDTAAKLIYLALNAIFQEWRRSARQLHAVKSQFAIMLTLNAGHFRGAGHTPSIVAVNLGQLQSDVGRSSLGCLQAATPRYTCDLGRCSAWGKAFRAPRRPSAASASRRQVRDVPALSSHFL